MQSSDVAALVGGRFELVRLLKCSQGVETHFAHDHTTGESVVVKVAAADEVPLAVRLRLQHEADVLSRLRGPSLGALVALEEDDNRLYVAQRFVAGTTLQERLSRGPLPPDCALRVAADVLRALDEAHGHGVLHRDVKPANIIMNGDACDRAVLIDFGYARSGGLEASVRNVPVGTVRYLAPEAAGLLDVGVDERSDLYSLGIVFFESLAGRPPFDGHDVGEVLRLHLNARPPALPSLGVAVPRVLDAMVQRLLAKDPADRYQTAAAALADAEEIILALDRGVAEPAVVVGRYDRRRSVTEPAFVGRTAELATLHALLAAAQGGRSELVLLEAESGGGKTRLLDELAQQAASSGAWVLRGQGVDRVAQEPYRLLQGVSEGIVSAALADPGLAGALGHGVGDRAAAVVAALPELAPVLGGGDGADIGPEAYGELRSLEALLSLLDALGSPDRPALVVLDDCQWADRLTVKLLLRWRQRVRAMDRYVLVVAAFRTEEVAAEHPLRSAAGSLSLGPLGAFEVRLLGESMAGPLPDEATAIMVRLSEGSPFMASAVLRGLVESGALRATETGWAVDAVALADVSTSRRAALFLIRRLELLSASTLELLSVGAVLGKEFELQLAVSLAGRKREVAPALEEARRRRILWVEERAGRCSFLHDKLREALLERMSVPERTRLHLAAAEEISSSNPDRVFEIAYHFHAAGEPQRALPHALEAAERARGQHALEVAELHYRMAAEAAAAPPIRRRVAEELGDVLTLQGNYEEAVAWVRLAFDEAGSNEERAALEGKLGDIAFKRGDHRQARESLERGLRLLGRRVPRRRMGFLLAGAREVSVQVLHTLAPRFFLHRRPLEDAEHELLAIRLYSRLAYVYWFHLGKVPTAWAHLRELNLAERYPPTSELAQAYSEHAPVCTMVPWFSRGIAYAERSLNIRRQLGDLWGEGQSLHFFGVVLYGASRYRECIDRCREAIRLLERTGDRWEVNTATWHVAFSLYRLGDLTQAVELCRKLHASALDIGDITAAGISLSGWSRASIGRIPSGIVRAELERGKEDAHTLTEVHLAEAVRLLSEHQPEKAAATLEAAGAIVRRAGLRQEYVAPVAPWLATARRLQAEEVSPYDSAGRRIALRRAARAARAARRLSRSFSNNAPHALRELAIVDALRGRPRRAARRFAQSLAAAERTAARYEAALTRQARARVGAGLGWPGAEEEKSRAEAEIAALEGDLDQSAPSTLGGGMTGLSLADRFATLLAAGRSIASAPSTDAVYTAVRHAALELLRGERCHVVAVGEDLGAVPTTESGERIDEFSRTLVARAVETEAPVVSGAERVDAEESLVLADVRSVLCAPVHCEGRPVACFYVTHRHVGGLFHEDDIQLAEFIATVAGAALEHLAGSEARFRSLAQHSTDVITIVRPDGVITYQSSAVEKVFGYSAGELVGRPLGEWLHPEDAPGIVAFLTESLRRNGGNALVECRLQRRDGSWCHVETILNNLVHEPTVRGIVLNTRDVTERKALEDELRARAWHDALTGLANRSLFADRVEHALARSRRQDSPVAVLFLDLDDFKAINDTLGHPVGDGLLQQVAERLLCCVRPGDTVARFGGDEFALLLEDSDLSIAELVVTRVMEQLRQPFWLSGQEIAVHASVGMALTGGRDGSSGEGRGSGPDETVHSAEELLANADAAMYRAKARGKGCYELFEPAMRRAAVERSTLRTDLELARRREELVLHYQPIVDIATGMILGFEGLVRWNHAQRGLLVPGCFIPIAEESGLIHPIGAWVLHRACLDARELTATAGRPVEMSVNLSTRQLRHPGLVREVAAALEESGLDPGLLTLEITESATIEDAETSFGKLRQLKDLGVRLAIDDFGTGYSSLAYLRRFPVDRLKIDRSFVAGLGRDSEDGAIVASVISLAHTFGLEAVAEGVETVGQLEALARLGCDLAQGYNWSRPEPVGGLARWLKTPRVPARSIRVLVADDRDEVRAGIRLALGLAGDFDVVGEAADGAEAVEAAHRLQPELVLLDVVMPGVDGLTALPLIRAAVPGAKVVLLSVLDPVDIPDAARTGSIAQLDKALDFEALARRLVEVAVA